jgi:hypothetical protein
MRLRPSARTAVVRSRAGGCASACLLLVLLGTAACSTTPTLPLPPPVASVAGTSQGLVMVEGMVRPRAFVSVFNERAEEGVITRADEAGYFVAELPGLAGDVLSIWQEYDGETGERKQLVVPEAPAAP